MREIKFRAWDASKKKMTYAAYVGLGGWHGEYHVKGGLCVGTFQDTDTPGNYLMQFTGLHDKNGKEIWEGDVLKDEHGTVCAVVWREEECGFIATKPYDGNSKCFTYDFGLYPGLHEVLGNIYEHPHLLNREEKV